MLDKKSNVGRAIHAKEAVVAGDVATTALAVTGMRVDSQILSIVGHDPDNVTPADQVKIFTGDFAPGDGSIAAATADTSGYNLVVRWYNPS